MLIIRSERPADYSALAALHYEAFLANYPPKVVFVEPLIVDLLRHHEAFDPELSIVAELDGQIVGHTLFSPYGFTVLGEAQRGVVVAPVAVHPNHQRKKIGAAILAEGHRRAIAMGYDLALLAGHADYYPRFGYLTSLYALSGSRLTVEAPAIQGDWAERSLHAGDLDWINAGWERLHASDALALNPGRSLPQWMGHGTSVQTSVLTKNGEPVAYLRYRVQEGALKVREFVLAQDEMAEPLAFLCNQHQARSLHLPFHASAVTLDWATQIEDLARAHPAFMIKPLTMESPVKRYCEQVLAGRIKPGIITFPAPFDI